MILIDKKNNEAFSNCSIKFISEKIGLGVGAIGSWKKKGKKKEVFNDWIVYLSPTKVKQKRGFSITGQPKKAKRN